MREPLRKVKQKLNAIAELNQNLMSSSIHICLTYANHPLELRDVNRVHRKLDYIHYNLLMQAYRKA